MENRRFSFQIRCIMIGIVGNILIILVLSTKDMRNSFNLLLIVLAWFDIFFIIIAVLDYSMARGITTCYRLYLHVIYKLHFNRLNRDQC